MSEISDATMNAWFKERCRCEECGRIATLGDLETCACGSHIWRHDCPVAEESFIEHSIEHDRNRLQADLSSLRAAVGLHAATLIAEAESMRRTENDPRYGPAIVQEAHAIRMRCEVSAARLNTILDASPDTSRDRGKK